MNSLSLPAAPESEKVILALCILDETAFGRVCDRLTVDHFTVPQHKEIWRQCQHLKETGTPVNMVTLLDADIPATTLTSLTDGVPTKADIEHYVRIVARKRNLRQQMFAAEKVLEYVESGGEDFALIESLFPQPDASTEAGSFEKISSALDAVLADTSAREDGEKEIEQYSTGTKALDEYFRYERGKLYVIAGRPSMGKTAFALGQADTLCEQGLRGMVFEQEMPTAEIAMRQAAAKARVPFAHLRDASPSSPLKPEEWARLKEAHDALAAHDLVVCDLPNRSIADVRTAVRQQANAGKPVDFVIFDYLQIASLPGKNLVQATGDFTREMKNLAREYNFIAIVLSQLSRVDKRLKDRDNVPPIPQLDDLRDSGCIEQDADLVAFLHRPEFYLKAQGKPVGQWEGSVQVSIPKQRGGPTGLTKLAWVGDIMCFTDPWWVEQPVEEEPETEVL